MLNRSKWDVIFKYIIEFCLRVVLYGEGEGIKNKFILQCRSRQFDIKEGKEGDGKRGKKREKEGKRGKKREKGGKKREKQGKGEREEEGQEGEGFAGGVTRREISKD